MARSPLTTRVDMAYSGNYSKGRAAAVGGIVIHHACAYSIESVARTFQTPGRNGSAHYTVCGNQISAMVNEEDTAWHCSNLWGNNRTIGIETCNSTLSPDYKIADDTMETLARLVADIAKRYGLGKLYINPNESLPKLSGHKDWAGASTACPGPYLYPRLQWLCDRANAINYPPTPAKPTLTWTKLDKMAEYKTKLQPTHLWGVNCTTFNAVTDVKQFNKGEVVEIVGKVHNKELGGTYLVTDYSWNKKTPNGFNEKDMELVVKEVAPTPAPEPTPAKPEIVWEDLPQKTGLFTAHKCSLINLDDGKVIQTYSANTKIDVTQTTLVDGIKYYRTDYSKSKGFNWAFRAEDFVEIKPAEPEPSAPTDNPINSNTDENSPINSSDPAPSQSGQDKNDANTNDDTQQDGSGDSSDTNAIVAVLRAIVAFVKKIINLLTSKKEK